MMCEGDALHRQEPVVSVIMPVYNAVNYVESAINSVLSQTFRDFELILVDDGSTDGSAQVCDACAERDGRIRVYRKENGGVSSARNYGMRMARGEYIAFIDHDDCYLPQFLEKMVAFIRETGVPVVRCGRMNIRTDEYETPQATGAIYPKQRIVLSNGEFAKAYRTYKSSKFLLTAVWNGLYKREFVQRHQIDFPESFRHGSEDVMFNVKAYMAGADVAFMQSILYIHFIRAGQSVSAVFHEELIRAELEVIELERGFIGKKVPEEAGIFDYFEFGRYMQLVFRVSDRDRKREYIRQIESMIALKTCPARYFGRARVREIVCWMMFWLRRYRLYFLAKWAHTKYHGIRKKLKKR